MSTKGPGETRAMRLTGCILSGLVIVFMINDAGSTLLGVQSIVKAVLALGYPSNTVPVIGVLELICLVLYSIPATSGIGAILLTALLGGAITSHLRAKDALTSDMILCTAPGVLAWGGLWFRDPRLRALIPFRRSAERAVALPDVSAAT